jgi:nucleoside-diphosphate-sugar epimerase
MTPQFRVIVIGGTGQVGSAVVQALLAESVCREVVMVTRKPVMIADPARLKSAWSVLLLAVCAKRVWRNSACYRQSVLTPAAGLNMSA